MISGQGSTEIESNRIEASKYSNELEQGYCSGSIGALIVMMEPNVSEVSMSKSVGSPGRLQDEEKRAKGMKSWGHAITNVVLLDIGPLLSLISEPLRCHSCG